MRLGPSATNPEFLGRAVSICDLIRQHVMMANPHTINLVVLRHLDCCGNCQAFMAQQGIASPHDENE